jgi:hypothetical protein
MKSSIYTTVGMIAMTYATTVVAALPAGWSMAHLDSEWLGPGNNQQQVCNGLARTKYGDRAFEVVGSSEDQKWRVPEFHIDAQYQYHCQVLVGPG